MNFVFEKIKDKFMLKERGQKLILMSLSDVNNLKQACKDAVSLGDEK